MGGSSSFFIADEGLSSMIQKEDLMSMVGPLSHRSHDFEIVNKTVDSDFQILDQSDSDDEEEDGEMVDPKDINIEIS